VDHPTLKGRRVTLRLVAEADGARLREILGEPGVARWWGLSSVVPAAAEPDDACAAMTA
jgi:hypothetical protein